MRILQATAEFFPFSKTGGLADMVAGLSGALAQSGKEVTVATPLYKEVRNGNYDIAPYGSKFKIKLGQDSFNGQWWETRTASGLQVLFLENEGFYNRPGLYMSGSDGYWDNPERFMFLSKAVAQISYKYDVVHVHDWQTAFVPMLLKLSQQRKVPRTILTIHNLAYQGQCEGSRFDITNLSSRYFTREGPEYWGGLNYLKAGLHYADQITTVSPGYAKEILTPEFGEGLEGVLQSRKANLTGILNGVDYEQWNTEKNLLLPKPYDKSDLSGKFACKTFLKSKFNFPPKNLPLYGTISRLAHQKGIDILVESLHQILCEKLAHVIILGSGDKWIVNQLNLLTNKFPDAMKFVEGYDNGLAHLIEAGSDFYIMPSRFEPCGLNQLYSLRYGTPPIVHAVGGLHDTVKNLPDKNATGIKFFEPTSDKLSEAINISLNFYKDKKALKALRISGMEEDFSWERSLEEYHRLYKT